MAKNSYTSSERRGIIAIAALAILITVAGLGLSLCDRNNDDVATTPSVYPMEAMADTIVFSDLKSNKKTRENSKKKITSSRESLNSTKEGSHSRKKSPKHKKEKQKKTYRQRSPLDEPI